MANETSINATANINIPSLFPRFVSIVSTSANHPPGKEREEQRMPEDYLFPRGKIYGERNESPTPRRIVNRNGPPCSLPIFHHRGSYRWRNSKDSSCHHRRLVNKHANTGPRKSITSSSIHPSRSILLSSRSGHQRYPSDDTVTISSRPWTGSTSTESLSPRWCGNPRTSYQLARTKGALFWTTASAPFCASLSFSPIRQLNEPLSKGTREERRRHVLASSLSLILILILFTPVEDGPRWVAWRH